MNIILKNIENKKSKNLNSRSYIFSWQRHLLPYLGNEIGQLYHRHWLNNTVPKNQKRRKSYILHSTWKMSYSVSGKNYLFGLNTCNAINYYTVLGFLKRKIYFFPKVLKNCLVAKKTDDYLGGGGVQTQGGSGGCLWCVASVVVGCGRW